MKQLYDVLWAEIAKWLDTSKVKQLLTWTKTKVYMNGDSERWFATAKTATKPENMQGFHEDHMMIVVDEASGVSDPIMEAILGTLTGSDNKLLLMGNPNRIEGVFFDAFNKDRYGFIPFFRLDNNRKQASGLKAVKALIDDYDLMACGLSNNLQDIGEGLYVVKGFQGADLDEMIQNIRVKKHIGVDADGGVDIKTIDIPYEARKVKLELDEKNIYRFGMGFNSAQLGDGNITNIVIKSRYALLDLKCNKLEIRLKQFLRQLLKVVLAEINEEFESDYQMKDVKIVFEREVMTNAQDNAQIELTDAQKQNQQINTLMVAANLLDDETILKAICEILDIDYDEVKARLDKQAEEQPESQVQQVQTQLNNVTPDDEGGDGSEQTTT